MTATVTPSVTTAAPARPAPASESSTGSDSAEPFASALDGAMSAGRPAVDDAGAQDGGDGATDQDEAAADGTTAARVEPAATAPGGVVAALWALLTGATTAADTAAAVDDAAAPAVAADALPPGLANAQAHGGRAVAHGVRGTQHGQLPTGAPAVPADPTRTGTPAVPAAGAPTTPPPVDAAAKAALEALAAAGVTQLVTEAATSTAADDVVPALVATAPAPAGVPSTGDGAAAPAPAPAAALPVPAAVPSGGASADAGSDPGARDEGTAAPDAVQTSGPAAPAAATAATTRPEATTGAAVAHPVSSQIARSVAVLRGAPDGSHTMTVVLTPDSLGPVEVSVTVHKGAVELTLRGAHEHGRAALLDAVPDLRRDLEAAGLTCSRLDVDRGGRDGAWSSSQQQADRPGDQGQGHGRGSQGDRSDGGARPWHRSADRGDGPRAATRTASGLDIKV